MTRDFPTHLARGVTSPDCIDGTSIKKCVFSFSKNQKEGLYEMSIQWLDNQESAKIAKDVLKRDSPVPKFGLGFAVIQTEDLEKLRKVEDYTDMDYCRAPTNTPEYQNPYHGHITLPLDTRISKRQLASELAMISTKYEYDQPLPTDNMPSMIRGTVNQDC